MKNNGWKSYLCLEIMQKMNRFALFNFKTPLGTPALRAPSAPPSSLCVCS